MGKKVTQDMANDYLNQIDVNESELNDIYDELMDVFDVGRKQAEKFVGVYLHMQRQFNGMKTGNIDRK